MWVANEKKKKFIKKYGSTAGLPLFDSILPTSHLPDWIWNGSEIKSEVFSGLSKKYKDENKIKYIQTVIKLGGNATDHEVEANSDLKMNIITARRNDLMEDGIVKAYKSKEETIRRMGPYGVKNVVWFLNFKTLQEIMYQ